MAVYTKISHFELEELISGYNIGTLKTYTGIADGIQNSNFFVDTVVNNEDTRYVLTIYENRINKDDLPFFLNLTEHLANHDVPCPLPIANNKGEKISFIQNKPCAIISYVKGTEAVNASIQQITEVGKNLARMHIAGQSFLLGRKNEMGIEYWPAIFNNIKEGADEIEPGISSEISNTLEYLNKNWPMNLPSGIIHGDVFPDNVLFADDGLVAGIIDFYFACSDILMYDLAICLNSWCFDKPEPLNPKTIFNLEKSTALLSSYNQVRKLSLDELKALPILATGAAMRFLLSRICGSLNHIDDALVYKKNPLEYLYKLRFHSTIKEPAKYGFIAA